MTVPGLFGKWLAVGTAVGIEMGRENLTATVVRVRPSGARILGELTIPGFRQQAASEWGAAYAAFLKKLGAAHLAATVLLPREEVMVRQIALPGVSNKDLAAAIRFEIDALNPYSEEEPVFDWARIGKTSSILIGITRRSVLAACQTVFAEAGVKVGSFTFSAPAIYSATRLLSAPPAGGFLLVEPDGDELEVYGESAARPLFSARLDGSAAKARNLAVAELRLPPETEPATLHDALPRPQAMPADFDGSRGALAYATALAGASLFPPLAVNLLPREQRQSSSRLRLVPSIALAVLTVLLSVTALAYPKYADRRYFGLLQAEIRKMEPRARRAVDLDRQVAVIRNRAQTLDNFRLRTKEDLDALNDITALLQPPAWLTSLQLTRDSLNILGQAEQAAPLLKLLDGSRQFRGSSFTTGPAKGADGEIFGIRAQRQGVTP
ncbi:MAG TPA: PilN domain-containing protein [Bryobacteraceae bacterium]|nr:PilN domain-containing protein [Bryobacteraceae bacterium]